MPACLPAHTRPMGHKATFLIITLLSYVNQWTKIVKKQHCLQQYGRSIGAPCIKMARKFGFLASK